MRLKYLLRHIDERLVEPDTELLSVSKTHGVVPRAEISDTPGRADDLSNYKTCQVDDLVINRMSAYQGALGVAGQFGAISPDYMVLRMTDAIRPGFAGYLFKSHFMISEMSSRVKGIGSVDSGSVRTPRLNWSDLGQVEVDLPPADQQESIADFLDHETAKIDALIAKQEQLINTLDERRGALILGGVTGRLSTGPRKKSRLSWLGDIPDHWTESKTRFHCQVVTGSGDTQDAVVDGAFPFYVRSDTPQRSERYEFDGDAVLTAGDGAGVGKVFHVVSGKFMAHQRVYVMNSFRGVTPEFFFYFFSSTFARFALDGTAKSTVDSLRRPMLTNHPILVPPLSEQIQIVELLDRAVESIDRLISAAQKTVQLLLERRQSLISAVVTGKLERSI